MHGVKKRAVPRSAEEVSAERSKASNYKKLMSHVVAARKAGDKSEAILGVVSKLLLFNCDVYSLWNYRREIIQSLDDDESEEDRWLRRELELTAQCLRKNPKSYPTWYHRRWCVSRCPRLQESELGLCAKFLGMDERNFHCWNYRRFLGGDEAFVRHKLEANFSNYSAYHDLAARLPARIDDTTAAKELNLVAQAIFTEPDDQSAWWYADCLLRKTAEEEEDVHHREPCARHAANLRHLAKLEPEAKWPKLALARYLLLFDGASADEVEALRKLLVAIDPGHRGMYGGGASSFVTPSSSTSSEPAGPGDGGPATGAADVTAAG